MTVIGVGANICADCELGSDLNCVPDPCVCTLQGTLKEKTVENLEKYVVKDVSTWYSSRVPQCTQRHTFLFFFVRKLVCKEALSFFFCSSSLASRLFPPGEAASSAQSNERGRQGFLGYQQRLQIHWCEYSGVVMVTVLVTSHVQNTTQRALLFNSKTNIHR